MLWRIPLFSLLFLLLASTLPAQGGREIPSKGVRKNRARIDLPRGTQDPAPPLEEDISVEGPAKVPPGGIFVSPYWGSPENRAEEIFVALESQQEDPKAMKAALDQLRGLGLETRTTALKALRSPLPEAVLLAAQLLEWVGDPAAEDAITLVNTASRVGHVQAAAACLDTSIRLNGGVLPARAVTLLSHPRRQLRTLAEARLAESPHALFQSHLIQHLLFGRESDTRHRAARLLTTYLEEDAAREALRKALADSSVVVALQAAEALAFLATNAQEDWLWAQVLESTTPIEEAYLLFSLLEIQRLSLGRSFSADVIDWLRVRIRHENTFLSGAAASLLADQLFRFNLAQQSDEIQKQLVFSLVRAVGGLEFYPQYARFAPVAEKHLQALTGVAFREGDRSVWLSWFSDQREDLQFVRAQLHFPDQSTELRVSWTRANGVRRTLAGFSADNESFSTRVLGQSGLDILWLSLEKAKLVGPEVLPGTYGIEEDPVEVNLLLEVGAQRKPLRFRGPQREAWLVHLLDTLDAYWLAQPWQMLAIPATRTEFLQSRVEEWEAASKESRPGLLVEWSRGRMLSLSSAVLESWCHVLQTTPNVAEFWDEAMALETLSLIGPSQDYPDLPNQLLQLGLLRPTPQLTGVFVNHLVTLEEPLRSVLLQKALVRLGTASAIICINNENGYVRIAAAHALGHLMDMAGMVPLLEALNDSDPRVVQAALQALATLKNPHALPMIAKLAGPGSSEETRQGALQALGSFGDASVLPDVLLGIRSQNSAVQLSAVNTLAQLPGADVDAAFLDLAPEFLQSSLASSFAFALESRGAGKARAIYRGLYSSTHLDLQRFVVLRSAVLGEPDAAAFLMKWLVSNPYDRDMLDALAMCTGADYRDTPDPAGVYTLWWEEHQFQDPSLWLVSGLRGRNFDLETNFVDGSGVGLSVIVADLLAVLTEGPAYLRGMVSRQLQIFTGIDLPPVGFSLPRSAVVFRAKPWTRWLAQQEGK